MSRDMVLTGLVREYLEDLVAEKAASRRKRGEIEVGSNVQKSWLLFSPEEIVGIPDAPAPIRLVVPDGGVFRRAVEARNLWPAFLRWNDCRRRG